MSERFKTSERGQTAEYMVRADKSDIMPQKLNSKTSKSISKIDPSIEEYDLMKTSFEEKDIKQQSLIQKLRRKIGNIFHTAETSYIKRTSDPVSLQEKAE